MELKVKATQKKDGSIEYEGTVDELREMFGAGASDTKSKRAARHPKRAVKAKGSLAADIRAIFAKNKKPIPMKEITAALASYGSVNVSSAVNRMSKSKNSTFEQKEHGIYQAIEKE